MCPMQIVALRDANRDTWPTIKQAVVEYLATGNESELSVTGTAGKKVIEAVAKKVAVDNSVLIQFVSSGMRAAKNYARAHHPATDRVKEQVCECAVYEFHHVTLSGLEDLWHEDAAVKDIVGVRSVIALFESSMRETINKSYRMNKTRGIWPGDWAIAPKLVADLAPHVGKISSQRLVTIVREALVEVRIGMQDEATAGFAEISVVALDLLLYRFRDMILSLVEDSYAQNAA